MLQGAVDTGRDSRTAAEVTARNLVFLALITLAACEGASTGEVSAADSVQPIDMVSRTQEIAVISERFETSRDTLDNIDSPAVWHGPEGQNWLLATAKDTDIVMVYDAATGATLNQVGGTGGRVGQMERPNGIAIADDLMFVVERDNSRVQVFSLPELQSVGIYGEDDLRYPYGVALVREAEGRYVSYITDNYDEADGVLPRDGLLGERVRRYRTTHDSAGLTTELIGSFGDTVGLGVLRVVESIAADPAHDRLLVAEEQEGASMLKLYSVDGRFTGQVIDEGLYASEAEGITLYPCDAETGFWVTTDQSPESNTFHVLDRVTLSHLGSFRGRTVLNTDGITATPVPFEGFPRGAFYAVHDDGSVAGFSWADIEDALGLTC